MGSCDLSDTSGVMSEALDRFHKILCFSWTELFVVFHFLLIVVSSDLSDTS